MRNKRRIIFAIVGLLLLVSCEERSSELLVENESVNSNQEYVNNEHALNELQPVILGEKLENPFSVENMQLALDSLMSKPNELEEAGVTNRSASCVEIYPTDWYICFKVDSTQFNKLILDTTLTLSQIPLDYEIIQEGDYLEEFQESDIKTLYTVVKPGYINPDGIDFEILEELFIPENSEYYSETNISQTNIENRSFSRKIMDDNFVTALLIQSFILTGNENQLPNKNQIENRMMFEECVQKSFLWWTWTDCNICYYPEGTVKIQTPKGYEPVKGIKMVMWRWFTRIEAVTDKNGYYKSKTKLNKLLCTNNIQCYLQMVGQNGENQWSMNVSVAGAVCLWNDSYNLGSFHPDRNDFKINVSHKAWGKCLINKAIYDYIDIARENNLTLPPKQLKVAVHDKMRSSSAPLLNNHLNSSFTAGAKNYLDVILGGFGETVVYAMLWWGLPDLMLCYEPNLNLYERMISTVWHELTHATHVQAMKNNKGEWFASKYWSNNVYQQAKNAMTSPNGDPYGKKGGDYWEYIALSEGWANYRQWKISKEFLKYNSIQMVKYGHSKYDATPYSRVNEIEYRYAALINDISSYVSDKVFEKGIASCNTISEFKNYLIREKSNYATIIKNEFDKYEEFN